MVVKELRAKKRGMWDPIIGLDGRGDKSVADVK